MPLDILEQLLVNDVRHRMRNPEFATAIRKIVLGEPPAAVSLPAHDITAWNTEYRNDVEKLSADLIASRSGVVTRAADSAPPGEELSCGGWHARDSATFKKEMYGSWTEEPEPPDGPAPPPPPLKVVIPGAPEPVRPPVVEMPYGGDWERSLIDRWDYVFAEVKDDQSKVGTDPGAVEAAPPPDPEANLSWRQRKNYL